MNLHYEADTGGGKGKRQQYELCHALREERAIALDLHGLEWFSSLKRKPLLFANHRLVIFYFKSAVIFCEILCGLYDLKWSIQSNSCKY